MFENAIARSSVVKSFTNFRIYTRFKFWNTRAFAVFHTSSWHYVAKYAALRGAKKASPMVSVNNFVIQLARTWLLKYRFVTPPPTTFIMPLGTQTGKDAPVAAWTNGGCAEKQNIINAGPLFDERRRCNMLANIKLHNSMRAHPSFAVAIVTAFSPVRRPFESLLDTSDIVSVICVAKESCCSSSVDCSVSES